MRRLSKTEKREAMIGYVFILPWIIGFLAFTAGPLVASAVISLTKWGVLTSPKFVGLNNYRQIYHDPYFWQSLKVTGIYMMIIPMHMIAGLCVAMLLNAKIRALSLLRTIYYLPCVVSGVAVSLLWVWVFNPQFGLFNVFLSYFGIRGPQWLGSQLWVLPAFMIMSFWGVGGAMLIYLAGLQNIPNALYDAATVDGASRWQKFRHVTLPSISPILLFNLIMGMIGTAQVFIPAFIMTGGGPGSASLFYVLYVYRNAFEYFKMGYASALAWILFGVVLVGIVVIFKFSKGRIYYAGMR